MSIQQIASRTLKSNSYDEEGKDFAIPKRPMRSQREILRILRQPLNISNTTSINQFMDDQIIPGRPEPSETTITTLLTLIKTQNKALQTLQKQVSLLKDRIPEESDSDTDVEETKIEITCDLCDEKHLAIYHCNDCSENLCETASTFHKKSKATKTHIILNLSDIKSLSKPQEEPTAILMELVDEYKIIGEYGGVCTGPNNEMISLQGGQCGEIHIHNRKGELLRKFGKPLEGQRQNFSEHIYCASKIGVSKEGDIYVQNENGAANYTYTGYPKQIKVYGLNGKIKHLIDSSGLTTTGHIFTQKCHDEEGNEFPVTSYPYRVCQNGDVYACKDKYIYVFNSSGKYLKKLHIDKSLSRIFIIENNLYVLYSNYTGIGVYDFEGKFLYRLKIGHDVINISLFPSGEICISTDVVVKIFRKGREYIQQSLQRNFHLVPKYQCDKNMNEMENRSVLSVTFPLSIPPFEETTNKHRPGIFTHTLYFDSLTSLKNAIFAVEEYFREKVSKSDFEHLSLLLSFEQEQYRRSLNIFNYNWAKCKKEKLVRGYFLGGNVLSSFEIRNDTELVLDLTQD